MQTSRYLLHQAKTTFFFCLSFPLHAGYPTYPSNRPSRKDFMSYFKELHWVPYWAIYSSGTTGHRSLLWNDLDFNKTQIKAPQVILISARSQKLKHSCSWLVLGWETISRGGTQKQAMANHLWNLLTWKSYRVIINWLQIGNKKVSGQHRTQTTQRKTKWRKENLILFNPSGWMNWQSLGISWERKVS